MWTPVAQAGRWLGKEEPGRESHLHCSVTSCFSGAICDPRYVSNSSFAPLSQSLGKERTEIAKGEKQETSPHR